MKRAAIGLFIAIILLPAIVLAQDPIKLSIPKIDLGLKLGANMAQLSGNSWDNGYKASFLGGIFTGFRAHKMGVQAELFFSQSNYSVQGHDFYDAYSQFYNNAKDSAKNGAFRVTYMNIPVLFQYKIVPLLWLQIGPQYSGVVSVKDADGLVKDAKSLFKSGSVSGVIGLELKLPLHINFGARYVIGFSDVNATNISGAWQEKQLQIHVGYTIL